MLKLKLFFNDLNETMFDAKYAKAVMSVVYTSVILSDIKSLSFHLLQCL